VYSGYLRTICKINYIFPGQVCGPCPLNCKLAFFTPDTLNRQIWRGQVSYQRFDPFHTTRCLLCSNAGGLKPLRAGPYRAVIRWYFAPAIRSFDRLCAAPAAFLRVFCAYDDSKTVQNNISPPCLFRYKTGAGAGTGTKGSTYPNFNLTWI